MVLLREIQSITAYDGESLIFTDPYHLQGFINYGMPTIEYITQKGYRQIGQSVRDFNLRSRNIALTLFTPTQLTRQKYWELREKLIGIFRPNRGQDRLNELTLTIRFDTAEKRTIQCFYRGGMEFEDVDLTQNAFRLEVTIQLFAPNPVWYNPTTVSVSPTASTSENLVFPITFPILFEETGTIYNTGELNYQGSWRSYPTITIDGPYTTATLTHEPGGAQILLNNAIGESEQRIITLSETGFSITDESGNDKFEDVLTADLVNFFIRPSDQYAGGETQQFSANLLNGSEGTSGVTIAYNEAYIGI